ncbi:MAG TPA: DUF3102 domain-containing protein [Syntrophorhabdus sp.]|nr:DUF3102 domain-containing protein [Syntrophorhabdus sp.]
MNELSCEAMRLRNLHVEILHGVYTVLDKAIEAGSILKGVKKSLPHGAFTRWVEDNTGINIRTAQRYMKIHDNKDQLKSDSVSFLNDAHKLLTAPREKQLGDDERELKRLEGIIEKNLPAVIDAGVSLYDCMYLAEHMHDSTPGYYIPPSGSALYISSPTSKILFALVTPHKQDGFYFRTWCERDDFDGMSLVGDTKGVCAAMVTFKELFNEGQGEKEIIVQGSDDWAGPWSYNELIFPSYEAYLEKRLGIRRGGKHEQKNIHQETLSGLFGR